MSASFYKEGAPAVSNGNPLPFYIKKLYQDVQCLNKGQAKDYTNVVSSIHELSLINALWAVAHSSKGHPEHFKHSPFFFLQTLVCC